MFRLAMMTAKPSEIQTKLLKRNEIHLFSWQQQQQQHDKQLLFQHCGPPDEIFGVGHLCPHLCGRFNI